MIDLSTEVSPRRKPRIRKHCNTTTTSDVASGRQEQRLASHTLWIVVLMSMGLWMSSETVVITAILQRLVPWSDFEPSRDTKKHVLLNTTQDQIHNVIETKMYRTKTAASIATERIRSRGIWNIPTLPLVTALPDLKQNSRSRTKLKEQQRTAKEKLNQSLSKTKTNAKTKAKTQTLPIRNHPNDPTTVTGNDDDDYHHQLANDRVRIEAFLARRRFPLRAVFKTACLCATVWSLLHCLRTAGIPYAQTVWQIVFGEDSDGAFAAASSVPSDYFPTAMESRLARMVLSASDDFRVPLPPTILPSPGPLLALVASLACYAGLVWLLPRWSTRFRVLLEFSRVPLPKQGASVLVGVGGAASSSSDDRVTRSTKTKTNLLVLPLQPSSPAVKSKIDAPKAKKKKPKATKTKNKQKGDNHNDARPPPSVDASIASNYIHPTDFYFDVDHTRIYCDVETKNCIEGGPTLHEAPLSALQDWVDAQFQSEERRTQVDNTAVAKERYGAYNRYLPATPTFREALVERISSPLVVVQWIGKLVSLLEDGWGAIVSLLLTLAQHVWNAKQAIFSAQQLAEEVSTNLHDEQSDALVSVWTPSKKEWVAVPAGDLLPGDIFRLNEEQQNAKWVVPVDALVLRGQCLTNEAILTGESVAQIKVPMDFEEARLEAKSEAHNEDSGLSPQRRLDLHKDRSSILFAGTTLFHTLGASEGGSNKNETKTVSSASGVTCLALRTGTYSSKGKLLKAMQGSARVGAISNDQSEKDSIRMIAALSFCALLSCGSLFVPSSTAIPVSPFRRVIQCTRIALASIPSNLPLALAAVARSCSSVLRHQSDVVCSEPGSLLTAAYVDTVVFDKTGTLTADTQSLSKVVSTPSQSEPFAKESFQRFVLAGCHSLVHFRDDENGKTNVVGDPLDQAALRFSRWKYNQTLNFYSRPETENDSSLRPSDSPARLWQICTFPFDPSRRLSSAIVLLERENSSLELWKLTKGSPDTMITMMDSSASNVSTEEFQNQTQKLEMQGYRSIALGAEKFANSALARTMFPNGLSTDTNCLAEARLKGETLHRTEVDNTPGLIFCGFGCFEASVRTSSKRIVNELNRGGLKCIMLTGDSVDAALSVARKVEMFRNRKIAVLERTDDSLAGDEVVWKILTSKVRKDGSFEILHHRTKTESVTVSSVRKYIRREQGGKCSLAANGRALEWILSDQSDPAGRLIAHNFAAISIVARATPELKKQVIETLKHECGKRVMMCGDGVNDVAAIQSADVAASLLTGFGAETSASTIDVDDKRRMKRLSTINIGSNRAENVANAKKREANERIQKDIEKYREERKNRSTTNDPEKLSEFEDLKEMVSATMRAAKNEQRRAEQLRKGGGNAARILAEERQEQLSGEGGDDEDLIPPPIKPGEASLVSSFSCLHPSVDGVDAILRQGVATAASALATQQAIGLHSLMSCFHLATLYRDGFRYGKHMWNVELFFYQILESAREKASCTPRPRLPPSVLDRPPSSMFEFGSIFETVSQAFIHISCMALSVRYSKHLEHETTAKTDEARLQLHHSLGVSSKKIGTLMDTLTKRSAFDRTKADGEANNNTPNSFFQRAPFRPNYETNSVFVFSILQSAISALVSHKGRPFSRGMSESRNLCTVAGATLLFAVACITGKLSSVTTLLEVKALPSRHSKVVFLGIVSVNIIACALCRYIADTFLSPARPNKEATVPHEDSEPQNAADHEEVLLLEEAENNWKGLRLFLGILFYLVMDIIL